MCLPVTSKVTFSDHPKVSHSTIGKCFLFLLLLITHLFVDDPFWENFTAGSYCRNQDYELEVQRVVVSFRLVIVWN